MHSEGNVIKPRLQTKAAGWSGCGFTVSLLIFATGAAGLMYQVAWQKYLSRLLGSDTAATAVILAVFLGGLAVGYRLMGGLSARIQKHFQAYALLEAGIGLWGIGFASFFALISQATVSWSLDPPFLLLVQGVFISIVLIGPPTICMGGTVPILTRGLSRSLNQATRVHAFVYALNTAGAFVGTLAAGFWLIQAFGLPSTVRIAAILNLLAAAFFACYRLPGSDSARTLPGHVEQTISRGLVEPGPLTNELPPARFSPRRLCLIAFMSGFSLMTMENVLIRIVNLSLGSSSYSFSMIVAAFILAIALGSFVVGFMSKLTKWSLFLNQTAVALLLLGLYITLDAWPYWAYLIRGSVEATASGFWVHNFKVFFLLTLILVLPVSFMGASLPIMFHELKRNLRDVGRHSGRLLSWNTVGNLLGSLVGGIALFYFLDNGRIFLTAVLTGSLAAYLASRPLSPGVRTLAGVLFFMVLGLVIFRPGYDHTRFAMGTFREPAPMGHAFESPAAFYEFFFSSLKLKFYQDGPAGTVSVIETRHTWKNGGKNRSILVNGKSDSATVSDIQTLRLSAHIPALLVQERQRALVIGLGTGVTAAELTLYPELEHIEVAEISPTVVKAVLWFSPFIHDLTNDPRVTIHLGDAFRILARSTKKWDLVISEPSNPWVVGVDQLFTRDFYGLVRQKLNDHGVLLQWMHLYEANEEILGMVINTLLSEFPHCRAFLSQPSDLLILASLQPMDHESVERLERTLANNQRVRTSLEEINIRSPHALLLREIWNSSAGSERFRTYGFQTLDHPRLHYLAGKSFFMGENIKAEFLFNSQTADLAGSFLLSGTEYWPKYPGLPQDFELLSNSVEGDRWVSAIRPLARALDLRARLAADPDQGTQPGDETDRSLRRVRLIMSPGDEQDYSDAGLEGSFDWERAQALIREKQVTRNWINPFPLDGLKDLLGRCVDAGGEQASLCKRELDRLQEALHAR